MNQTLTNEPTQVNGGFQHPLLPALRVRANPDLVKKLGDLLALKGPDGAPLWSRNAIAKALGQNSAYVSLYVRQNETTPPDFTGNLLAFESRIEDFLKSLSEKKPQNDATFDTAVSRSLARFVDSVKSVAGIGIFHGNAGLGKTMGIQRYKQANPLAITVPVFAWCAGRDAILSAIFRQVENKGWDTRQSRAEWLCERLQGRSGALIFDNAHKLTHGAYSLIFDLHDRTGVPIVLVGNPTMIQKLRQDDQLFSRVSLKREARFKDDSLRQAVEAMLEREMPAHCGALRALAGQVARERGHLRSLKHHLRVTRDFATARELADRPISQVFKTAHESLIHEGYALED